MLPSGDALRKAALADQRRHLSGMPSNLNVSTANLGAYDNKVVASSLGGGSEVGSVVGGNSPISAVFSRPPAISGSSGGPGLRGHDEGRPSISSSSAAALLRPNLNLGSSTSLATSSGATNRPLLAGPDSSTHPSHPSSPWSHCSMHVLALFNGTPLPLPFEDLNSLVRAHIKSTTSRSPSSYRSVLSSDLQELISSGMLTLKAKLETVSDRAKWLARLAEVWQFYFGILPHLQGVFLPISLIQPLSSPTESSHSQSREHLVSTDARHLLLCGFLLYILLPILPRLGQALMEQTEPPTADQLGRLQHMCLILSTQAKPSSFHSAPTDSHLSSAERDDSARSQVEGLLRIIVRLRSGGEGTKIMDMLSGGSGGLHDSHGSGLGAKGDRRGFVGSKGYGHRRTWTASRVIPTDLLSREPGALDENEAYDEFKRRERRDAPSPNVDDSASEAEDDRYVVARRALEREQGQGHTATDGFLTAASTYGEIGMAGLQSRTYDSQASSMATPTAVSGMLGEANKDATLRPRRGT